MKKLERMDGELFESLKPNALADLSKFNGGIKISTVTNNPDGSFCGMDTYDDETNIQYGGDLDWQCSPVSGTEYSIFDTSENLLFNYVY